MSGSGVCTPLLNRYSKCLSNLSTKIVKRIVVNSLVPMTLGFQVMVKPGLFHTNRKRHWHQDFGFSIALCLVSQLGGAFLFFSAGGGGRYKLYELSVLFQCDFNARERIREELADPHIFL